MSVETLPVSVEDIVSMVAPGKAHDAVVDGVGVHLLASNVATVVSDVEDGNGAGAACPVLGEHVPDGEALALGGVATVSRGDASDGEEAPSMAIEDVVGMCNRSPNAVGLMTPPCDPAAINRGPNADVGKNGTAPHLILLLSDPCRRCPDSNKNIKEPVGLTVGGATHVSGGLSHTVDLTPMNNRTTLIKSNGGNLSGGVSYAGGSVMAWTDDRDPTNNEA